MSLFFFSLFCRHFSLTCKVLVSSGSRTPKCLSLISILSSLVLVSVSVGAAPGYSANRIKPRACAAIPPESSQEVVSGNLAAVRFITMVMWGQSRAVGWDWGDRSEATRPTVHACIHTTITWARKKERDTHTHSLFECLSRAAEVSLSAPLSFRK